MSKSVAIIDAELAGFDGLSRRIAMRTDQRLTHLHRILQEAFGWADDHLYSFWLGEDALDAAADEHTAPHDLEPGMKSAKVTLSELGLEPNQPLTYVFDFGDHWEVALRVVEHQSADDGRYPRVIASGEPRPQYGNPED